VGAEYEVEKIFIGVEMVNADEGEWEDTGIGKGIAGRS